MGTQIVRARAPWIITTNFKYNNILYTNYSISIIVEYQYVGVGLVQVAKINRVNYANTEGGDEVNIAPYILDDMISRNAINAKATYVITYNNATVLPAADKVDVTLGYFPTYSPAINTDGLNEYMYLTSSERYIICSDTTLNVPVWRGFDSSSVNIKVTFEDAIIYNINVPRSDNDPIYNFGFNPRYTPPIFANPLKRGLFNVAIKYSALSQATLNYKFFIEPSTETGVATSIAFLNAFGFRETASFYASATESINVERGEEFINGRGYLVASQQVDATRTLELESGFMFPENSRTISEMLMSNDILITSNEIATGGYVPCSIINDSVTLYTDRDTGLIRYKLTVKLLRKEVNRFY